MDQQKVSPAFQQATKAIEKIKSVLPKLNESEKATLEILLDEESRNHLTQSLKDAKAGNTVSWEEAMKELGK
jgi:O6-methylguanine-DNA--protein-cysteine methyltransferase